MSERRTPRANCNSRPRPYHGRVTELHRNLIRSMKRRRSFLAISQMELAERAGISPGYVGEVEMGRKYPSPDILERIAAALEVRPYRLLMSDEDVADAAGQDAVYEAADRLKQRLSEGLDELVSGLAAPASPRREPETRKPRSPNK